MKKSVKIGVIAWFVLLNFQPALAQNKGQLKGRIADILNAAIANNKIMIENTTSKFEVDTDENGKFAIELPAGIYKVSSEEVPGFTPFRLNKLEIKSDQTRTLNVMMKPTLKDATCVVPIASSPLKKDKDAKKKQ